MVLRGPRRALHRRSTFPLPAGEKITVAVYLGGSLAEGKVLGELVSPFSRAVMKSSGCQPLWIIGGKALRNYGFGELGHPRMTLAWSSDIIPILVFVARFDCWAWNALDRQVPKIHFILGQ
ncbi:hypothetical protein BS47DRAFT_1364573 [Hydnum rufescens UP504]|uniref:Uncharacterized protein n=1 Tax=Hydnum rufescens UP504 TaxID=1448309 RepID=A0A9P6DTB4_9AGAM|nr:hypothetical protein BS47DRAFT_1364573 [Hydnum rufescens UP504]